jgi:hypothetical protein
MIIFIIGLIAGVLWVVLRISDNYKIESVSGVLQGASFERGGFGSSGHTVLVFSDGREYVFRGILKGKEIPMSQNVTVKYHKGEHDIVDIVKNKE